MGFVYFIIVVAFWMWVVKKIIDIDKRTKEIAQTLAEILNKLDERSLKKD